VLDGLGVGAVAEELARAHNRQCPTWRAGS
jgi:hypothetical protein